MKLKFLITAVTLFLSASLMGATVHSAEELFQLCSTCHGMKGEGNKRIAAPAIAGMPEWYVKRQLTNFQKGGRGTHADDRPGMRMRPMAKTLFWSGDKAIDTISKYVSELKHSELKESVKGSPLRGRKAFAACQACHGEKAQGNQALNAPNLTVTNDWYLLTQLMNFKNGVRGGNPMIDPTGASMAPMAAGLSEQAMKDIVAYIQTLR